MTALSRLMVELGLDSGNFDKGLNQAKGSLGTFSKIAIGGLAATAIAAVGTGVALFKIGDAYDSMSDGIAVATGATGKQLDALDKSAVNVFKSIPTSMEIAGQAIAALKAKTGDTGKTLEGLAKSEIELARITKTDLAGNIAASAKVFNLFGVSAKDQTKTLDQLFNVSQRTGVGIDQLMQETSALGPTLKNMGLTAGQSANLIGKMDQAGLHTAKDIKGMNQAIVTGAKAGMDAKASIKTYATAVLNAGSTADATAIASKYFGKSAGPELAAALRDGTISVDDLTGSVDENGKSILDTAKSTYDFSENFKILKNNVEAALIPLGSLVFQGLNLLIPLLTAGVDGIGKFASAMGDAFGSSAKVSDLIKQFPGWLQPLANALLLVADAAGDVVRGFQTNGLAGAFDALGPAIQQAIGALGGFAINIVVDIGSWILGKIPDFGDWLDKLIGGTGGGGAGMGGMPGTSLPGQIGAGFGPDAAPHVTVSALAVDILGFAAGKIADLWGWVEGLFGVGGTSATGDGTGGPDSDRTVTISSIAVSIASDAWSLVSSIDWTGLATMIATGAAKGIADIAGFADPIASAAWDKIKTTDWTKVVTSDSFGAGSSFGTTVHDAIVSGVKAAIGAIKDADISASDVGNVISAVGSAIVTAAKNAPTVAAGIAVGIASFIAGALAGLVFGDADMSGVPGKIGDAISSAITDAKDWASGIVTAIHDGITTAVAGVTDWSTMLLDQGTDLVTGIYTGANNYWTYTLSPWFTSIPTLAVGAIGDVTQSLLDKGTDLVTGVYTGANNYWTYTLSPWVASIPTLATGAIGDDIATALSDKGTSLIQGLWDGALDQWILFSDFLGERGGVAYNAVGDVSASLKARGVELIEGVWDGAGDQWDLFTDWLAGLGADAYTWVGDLSGALYDQGTQLVAGIVSGITDKAGDITSAIQGLVHGDITILGQTIHYANGGVVGAYASGGVIPAFANGGRVVMVGERGPELAALPVGTRVFSHSDTMGMLRNSQGGDDNRVIFEEGAIVVVAAPGMNEEAIADAVIARLNRAYQLKMA